ncbi:S9 family peptidase, partial [Streptomyces sp. NPDC059506]
MTVEAPYGTWTSPVDARLAAGHAGAPEFIGTVGDEVWWTEPRPDEGGRRPRVRPGAAGPTPTARPPPVRYKQQSRPTNGPGLKTGGGG